MNGQKRRRDDRARAKRKVKRQMYDDLKKMSLSLFIFLIVEFETQLTYLAGN